MFNRHDIARDACQLFGAQAHQGYDWWWHSFTGYDALTGEAKPFFIEFFLCNPASGRDDPVFGQLPENRVAGIRPSYLMVKVGAWGEDAAQLHRFWGWKRISVDWGVPFSIEADDCFLTIYCCALLAWLFRTKNPQTEILIKSSVNPVREQNRICRTFASEK